MTKIERVRRCIEEMGTATRHEVNERIGPDRSFDSLMRRLEQRGEIKALAVLQRRGAGGRLVTVYRSVDRPRRRRRTPDHTVNQLLAKAFRALAEDLERAP